jgi:hypothetical protein
MVKPKRSLKFYLIIAFFMSSALFISGLSIGFLFNDLKQSNMQESFDSMKSMVESAEIELVLMDFLKEDLKCEYFMKSAKLMATESHELWAKVVLYEKNGILNDEYYSLKKSYVNSLIKNWVSIEKSKQICELNYSTILYFYTNPNDCPRCSEQGNILDAIRIYYNNEILIFPLDANLELDAVDILINVYNVTKYPSLVINGETHLGYLDYPALKDILDEK